MRAIILAGAALAALLAAGPRTGVAGAAEVAWRADYELALEEALLTRRPLLVTFYADWCGWCRQLERTTFRDRAFVDRCGDLIPVRVNGEQEKSLAALFRVTDFPTTLVLSRQGRVLERITGYRPPAEFVARMEAGLDDREPAAGARAETLRRPDDPEVWYDLGEALLARGEYGEAREAFDRAGELSEAAGGGLVSDARLDAALSLYLAGDAAGAAPGFADYLRRFPDSDRRDQGLFWYGRALVDQGRAEEGLTQLEEAAALTSLRYIRREAERMRALSREEGQGG